MEPSLQNKSTGYSANDILFCIRNHSTDLGLSNHYIIAKKVKGSTESEIMVNLWKRSADRSTEPDTPLCEHVLSGNILKDWAINEREPYSSIFCPTCEKGQDRKAKIHFILVPTDEIHLPCSSRRRRNSRIQSIAILDGDKEDMMKCKSVVQRIEHSLARIGFKREESERTDENLQKDLLNAKEVEKALASGKALKSVIREFGPIDDPCPKDDVYFVIKVLGRGQSSTVLEIQLAENFGGILGGTRVAMKTLEEDFEILEETTKKGTRLIGKTTIEITIHELNEYLNETAISSLMNQFVQPNADKNFACPHFPLFYGYFVCDESQASETSMVISPRKGGPSEEEPSEEEPPEEEPSETSMVISPSKEGYMIIELFDGTLPSEYTKEGFDSLFEQMNLIDLGPTSRTKGGKRIKRGSPLSISRTSYTLRYIYFQVLFSLVKAQKHFEFVHNDLHSENVMFKRIKEGDMWQKQRLDNANGFRYTMKMDDANANSGDLVFMLENIGFLSIIADFGWSSVFSLKNHDVIFREDLTTPQAEGQAIRSKYGFKTTFSRGYDIVYFTLSFMKFSSNLLTAQGKAEPLLVKEAGENILQFVKDIAYDLMHSISAPIPLNFDNFDENLSSQSTIENVVKFIVSSGSYLKNGRPNATVVDLHDPKWILRNGKTIQDFRKEQKGKFGKVVEMCSI